MSGMPSLTTITVIGARTRFRSFTVRATCSWRYQGSKPAARLSFGNTGRLTAIVALLRARLGALRTETARPQQSSDVIRMVDDLEAVADDVDDPPARPEARGVAGGFRSGHDQARQLPPLRRRQLRWSTRRRTRAKARPALPPVRALPPTHGAPIDSQAFGHDMKGKVTLEQVDRADSAPLELGRAALWAHAHLPQRSIGHYLCRNN
jgi:hypothetical protein